MDPTIFSNFIVAVGAVVPIFILISIGLFIKKIQFLTPTELNHVNRMVFRVFFAIMMFYNIYHADFSIPISPTLLIFAGAGVIAMCVLFTGLVMLIEPSNKRRGAMSQAIWRSNFVLLGIPVVGNIFGDDNVLVPTVLISVVIPIYNVLAVFILETFRGGKFKLWPILRGVLTNPMIDGLIVGFIFQGLGIKLPAPVVKPLAQIAALTSPIALIVLGASFTVSSLVAEKKQLIFCVVSRLILVPAIMLTAAAFCGFRGIEFVSLIAVFATPCAVASYAMAQQMGSDGPLAGNCVIITSALSCITIFGWIFASKMLGMF